MSSCNGRILEGVQEALTEDKTSRVFVLQLQFLSKDADELEHLLRIRDFSGFHCEKRRKPGRNGALVFLLPEPLPPSFFYRSNVSVEHQC